MIEEYYIVNWIALAGESLSGEQSEAKLVYCYRVNSETDSKPLRDFVNGNILESIRKVYPTSLFHSENYYDRIQIVNDWGWLMTHPSFDLWMTPDVNDEDFKNAAGRKYFYDEKFPDMPSVHVKVYMEKCGSNLDAFSPFNSEIVLRYPLRMIPQEMNFVRALHAFVEKGVATLEDITT